MNLIIDKPENTAKSKVGYYNEYYPFNFLLIWDINEWLKNDTMHVEASCERSVLHQGYVLES